MRNKSFWDFCAPVYDLAEKTNGRAYSAMLTAVRGLVPQGASVLEAGAGTGSISLAVSGKAGKVLCTDISEPMLNIARRKILKRRAANITVDVRSIFDLGEPESSFDVVIAGQVLHLIDTPDAAAAELRRVAKSLVILPISLTANLRGTAKLGIALYRLLGFSPKEEFSSETYAAFLPSIGFEDCELIQIPGKIPITVAIWRKRCN